MSNLAATAHGWSIVKAGRSSAFNGYGMRSNARGHLAEERHECGNMDDHTGTA